ncbi:hypothetical protein [Streptomyces iconiensis]|uniref:Integral membrane protein n=1 Tax=Streptomyces iconiensis TaxID=1384038 RepID=A0ABT7A5U4_9ACTN|nr:hypothetical protein [Streptomyces iconiensis]MDJ1136671.1 hypothetical protein [Streptomyces iconiensis]
MFWEALGSAALGLALAYAVDRRCAARLPDRRLVLATGPVAALVGGLIARTVLGPGHVVVTLVCALGVSAALLSLLFRDEGPGHRQWRKDPLRASGPPRGNGGSAAAVRRPAPARPSASYGPR